MIGYRYCRVFSVSANNFYSDFPSRYGFFKTKQAGIFVYREIFLARVNFNVIRNNNLNRKMTDYGHKPRMTKFHTELSNYARIQKERAKYLSMSLEEKMEKSRMRGRPLTVADIPTWVEYMERSHHFNRKNTKSRGASVVGINDKVSVWQGDITRLAIGAICNAANKSLLGGGGVDGAIHRAAGNHLYQECKTLCGCNTGEAKMSAGYLLPAKYVIHTVGPIIHSYFGRGGDGVDESKREQLRGCYESCLNIVLEHNRKHRKCHLANRTESRTENQDTEPTEKSEPKDVDSGERLEKSKMVGSSGDTSGSEGDASIKGMQREIRETSEGSVSDPESKTVKDSGKRENNGGEKEDGSKLASKENKMDVDAAATEEKADVESSEPNRSASREGDGSDAEGSARSSEKRTVEKMELGEELEENHKGTDDGTEADGSKRIEGAVDVFPPEPLIESIAFPCISTGVYGYPQNDAVKVALDTCREWLEHNPDNELKRIIFCVYLDSDLHLYEKLLPRFFPLKGSDNEDDVSSSSSQDDDTSPQEDKISEDKTSDAASPSSSPVDKQDNKKYKPSQDTSD